MKPGRWRRFLARVLFYSGLVALPLAGGVAWAVYHPRDFVVHFVNQVAPELEFSAAAVRWTSIRSLEMEEVRLGPILQVPRLTLRWEWRKLWRRRLDELKLDHARVYLDLQQLGRLGAAIAGSTEQPGAVGAPWHLTRLTLERGSFVMVGIGPTVPPLSMEMEGEYLNVPLGGRLSEAERQEKRVIELRQIHIPSSIDPAVSVLSMEHILIEFSFAGLQSHRLESLLFHRPILDVDRGLFWFVEDLRKAEAARGSAPAAGGGDWQVRNFLIREGQMNISRLREISIQYPFGFEASRKDLNLQKLSLAQFQIELNIPKQDLAWHAAQIFFKSLHGKIAFNLSETAPSTVPGPTGERPVNDLVNTLQVESIRWKELVIDAAWLVLTFDPTQISGSYGGSFASGYLTGGLTCGWSGAEPWRLWGGAHNVDVGEISDSLKSELGALDGRAGLGFDLRGQETKLDGDLNLRSRSAGTLRVHSLRHLLDRIEKNVEGPKQALLTAFVESVKNYPYRSYELDAHYSRPDASVHFLAEGEQGRRKLDLDWHGGENGESRNRN